MKFTNKALFTFMAAIAFVAAFVFVFDRSAAAQDGEDAECGQECRVQLAQVRAATAKYHNVQEAIADGYAPLSPCVALPTGPAMGIHYVNIPKIDANLNVAEPEVLVYLPDAEGDLTLVAAEYMIPTVFSPEAPELMGQHFHPGPQSTWTLHAWIWRHNPSGMFADFNPKLTCPAQ
ncbi:MAG TPA: hypothetical protein VJL58_09295 [Pyrinomonadaceae bacterium]|nr:hypothetical protein [Pyrinomonadaceae bacterium]